MRLTLAQPFQRAIDHWLFRLHGPQTGEVLLNQRRVFILPTKAGLAWGLMVLGLFIGSVNYGLNMGFALTFLIAACSLVGMLLTFRNLAWLRLSGGRCGPVFAGDQALYELHLRNDSRHARYAIALGFMQDGKEPEPALVDLPSFSDAAVQLACEARQRGWQSAPRIRLQTRFPLGLFRAWSFWTPDLAVLVYPRAEDNAPPLPAVSAHVEGEGRGAGQEDFAGVRAWQAGDAKSRLAWRQIARMDNSSHGLVSKSFEGGAGRELCLDESRLRHLPLEARLSRLTAWVLQAQSQGLSWRFVLGATVLPSASGSAHAHECLRLLALYPGEPA
jgi:uncharacterized protein (DUF58 family)